MRLLIRVASPDDAPGIANLYRPFVVESPTSFERSPPDADEMGERIRETLRTHPWVVAEGSAGEVLGYAYGGFHRLRHAYRWTAEVSAYVDPRRQGAGLGRALYGTLFEILERQRVVTLVAGITLPNARSVGFHESMGFRPIGVYHRIGFKLGRWWDVGWYERGLASPGVPPDPFIPFPELRSGDG